MTLYRTDAPRAYDGFGTVTVYAHEHTRLVVVAEAHETWQLDRYGSGMYAAEEVCHDAEQVRFEVRGALRGLLNDLVAGTSANPRETADDVLALVAQLEGAA